MTFYSELKQFHHTISSRMWSMNLFRLNLCFTRMHILAIGLILSHPGNGRQSAITCSSSLRNTSAGKTAQVWKNKEKFMILYVSYESHLGSITLSNSITKIVIHLNFCHNIDISDNFLTLHFCIMPDASMQFLFLEWTSWQGCGSQWMLATGKVI